MTRMGRVPPDSRRALFRAASGIFSNTVPGFRPRKISNTCSGLLSLNVPGVEMTIRGNLCARMLAISRGLFPGHGPEDQHCFPGKYPVEGIHQAADGERCMSAVQDNWRVGSHHLHSPRQGCCKEPVPVALQGDLRPGPSQGQAGQGGVLRLELTQEGEPEVHRAVSSEVEPKRCAARVQGGGQALQLFVKERDRRAARMCGVPQHPLARRRLESREGRGAGLENAGLLECDLLDGVSQDVHVLQVQGGDHGRLRHYDVGCIQPAADPRLYDGLLAAASRKYRNARRVYSSNVVGAKCPGMPSWGSESTTARASWPMRTRRSGRGCSPAIAILSNALVTCGEVYRQVPVAGGVKDGSQERGGRAFPFRAGDVDDAKARVRVIEKPQEVPHPVQAVVALVVGQGPLLEVRE